MTDHAPMTISSTQNTITNETSRMPPQPATFSPSVGVIRRGIQTGGASGIGELLQHFDLGDAVGAARRERLLRGQLHRLAVDVRLDRAAHVAGLAQGSDDVV